MEDASSSSYVYKSPERCLLYNVPRSEGSDQEGQNVRPVVSTSYSVSFRNIFDERILIELADLESQMLDCADRDDLEFT